MKNAPLTQQQMERLVSLFASAPLTRRAIDTELTHLGWVQNYDTAGYSVEPARDYSEFYDESGAVRKDLRPV